MTDYIKKQGYEVLDINGMDSRAFITVTCGNKDHDAVHTRFADFSRKDRAVRCTICNGIRGKITPNRVKAIVSKRGYELKSVSNGVLNLTCPEGHNVHIPFSSFRQGTGCGRCRQSRTEFMLDRVLCYLFGEDNIEFNHSIKYKGRLLRFDFYIKTTSSVILIEYDGAQHTTNRFQKSDKEFEAYLLRDSLKTEYATVHNIPFLRVAHPVYGAEAIIRTLLFLNRRLPKDLFFNIVEEGLSRYTPQANGDTFGKKKAIANRLLDEGMTIKKVHKEFEVGHNAPIIYFRQIYGMGTRDYDNGKGKLWNQCIEG
jgi:ribosomal protein S27E